MELFVFICIIFQTVKQTWETQAENLQVLQEVREKMEGIFRYFNGYWIQLVTPEKFSVFKDARKTNNVSEIWYRKFNYHVNGGHQNAWTFVGKNLIK